MTPISIDSDDVIRIENLTHAYKTHLALGGVSFTVRRKSIHGCAECTPLWPTYIGTAAIPNGAP